MRYFLLVFFMLSGFVQASQEGVEILSTLEAHTPNAKVSIAQSPGKVESFVVSAFGKKYQLTSDQLKMISSIMINGVQISGESGYPELGGQAIYIKVFTGFSSGIRKSMIVTVSEENGISVR